MIWNRLCAIQPQELVAISAILVRPVFLVILMQFLAVVRRIMIGPAVDHRKDMNLQRVMRITKCP